MNQFKLFILLICISSCGTGSKRVFTGSVMGAATGVTGGVVLSPNSESRGMNALVFGLTGGVIGGIIGSLTDTSPSNYGHETSLKDRDQEINADHKLYEVESSEQLPAFVKERLKKAVIEGFTNRDTVDEDGALHEPHKVYRIKRQAELFSKPKMTTSQSEGSKK